MTSLMEMDRHDLRIFLAFATRDDLERLITDTHYELESAVEDRASGIAQDAIDDCRAEVRTEIMSLESALEELGVASDELVQLISNLEGALDGVSVADRRHARSRSTVSLAVKPESL